MSKERPALLLSLCCSLMMHAWYLKSYGPPFHSSFHSFYFPFFLSFLFSCKMVNWGGNGFVGLIDMSRDGSGYMAHGSFTRHPLPM